MFQQAGHPPPGNRREIAARLGNEQVVSAGAVPDRLMEMPAIAHGVTEARPAHKRGVQAFPRADLFHHAAEQDHPVGGFHGSCGMKGDFQLARAEFHLHGPDRQFQGRCIPPDEFHHRFDTVIVLFGQVLVAMGEQCRIRGLLGFPAVVVFQVGCGDPVYRELHLQPANHLHPGIQQPRHRLSQDVPGGQVNRTTVMEEKVGKHPAGARRPGQHAERGGIGNHHQVRRPGQDPGPEAGILVPHGKHRGMRCILEQQRAGDRHTVLHRLGKSLGHDRLAPQNPVLIGEGNPHGVRIPLPDALHHGIQCGGPVTVVQPVAGRETGFTHWFGGFAQGADCRRRSSTSIHSRDQLACPTIASTAGGPVMLPVWAFRISRAASLPAST